MGAGSKDRQGDFPLARCRGWLEPEFRAGARRLDLFQRERQADLEVRPEEQQHFADEVEASERWHAMLDARVGRRSYLWRNGPAEPASVPLHACERRTKATRSRVPERELHDGVRALTG